MATFEQHRCAPPRRHTAPAETGVLRHPVEQLWSPILKTETMRLSVSAAEASEAGWKNVEAYRALPSLQRATMLLPTTNRAALLGAVTNFRRLRAPLAQSQRAVIGAAVSTGVPLPFPSVRLQSRLDAARRPLSPTELLAAELGYRRLSAAIGIRTGSNRKATLQLVDDDGAAVGFAKFGWDQLSASAIVNEIDALTALDGGQHGVATPRVIHCGDWHGHPFLVVSPLPASSRRLRGTDMLLPEEFYALCPVMRTDELRRTRQYDGLVGRLGRWESSHPTLTGLMRTLLGTVGGAVIPVTARWHGDLTPWNCARSADGRLQVWDWESSESDVVAGLDAVHWAISVHTQRGARLDGLLLKRAVADAGPVLLAAGHPHSTRAAVSAIYAVALVQRALDSVDRDGEWDQGWLRASDADDLLRSALSMTSGINAEVAQ